MQTISFAKPIFLIGLSHVGKSSIGKKLSQRFNCKFIDLDKKIEKNTGVTIATIFDYEGEEGFRKHEQKALTSIKTDKLKIIATGAGSILDKKNRQFMTDNGLVVYLQIEIDELITHAKICSDRPLLKNKDPEIVFREMATLRNPLYEQTAQIIVPVLRTKRHQQISKVHTAILEYL